MIPYTAISLAILAVAGCLFLMGKKPRLRIRLRSRRKRKRARRVPPAVQKPKEMPAFIEEMRRRDQSMKDEIADTNGSEIDLQEMAKKEKEIMGDPRSSASKTRPIIELREIANRTYGSKEQKREDDDHVGAR